MEIGVSRWLGEKLFDETKESIKVSGACFLLFLPYGPDKGWAIILGVDIWRRQKALIEAMGEISVRGNGTKGQYRGAQSCGKSARRR